MTLVMSLPQNDAQMCRAAFEAGADVVKVHCNVQHRASGNGFGPLSQYQDVFARMLAEADGPMGLVPGASLAGVQAEMYAASALPFSFFSLYLQHIPPSIRALPQALMAACGPENTTEDAALLEAVGAQVLEASIMPPQGYGKPLSLQDVLQYRRICDATSLPVVVPTQRHISPEDVPYLAEAGVRGLMIGAIVTGGEATGIARTVERFRQAIDRL